MIFSARRQPIVRIASARTRGFGSAVSYTAQRHGVEADEMAVSGRTLMGKLGAAHKQGERSR